MKQLLLFGTLGLSALLLGLYIGWEKDSPPAETATLAQISLPDINKELRNGNEWLGKVVVVNHWGTWCPPCIEEIPLLIEYQKRSRHLGVQIVGIAHDLVDTTRAYSDSVGMNYPSLVAITDGTDLMRQQGNRPDGPLPFTAFFDRSGNLVHSYLGKLSEASLDEMVRPLL